MVKEPFETKLIEEIKAGPYKSTVPMDYSSAAVANQK